MINTERRDWLKMSTFLSFALSFSVSTDCRAERGLVLQQSSSQQGLFKTVLSKSGIRVERDGSKAYLVAKPPSWRVVFYNPANHKAIDMTYDQWIHHESFWSPLKLKTRNDNAKRLEQTVEKIGRIKYANRMCEWYRLRAMDYPLAEQKRYWGEVYGLTVPNISMPAVRILEKLLEIPQTDALPLFAKTFVNPAAQQTAPGEPLAFVSLIVTGWHLSTTTIIDQDVSEKLFVYPTKLTKVQRECDVLLDDNIKEKADEAFELIK